METETPITIKFVVPDATAPGAPKRKMQMLKMARVMAKIRGIIDNPTGTTDEQFDAMDEALMWQYKYYASFVQGCTPEQALEYIMDCNEQQIAEMDEALSVLNGPKVTPESPTKNEETSAVP